MTTTSNTPIPVVICGRTPAIAKFVTGFLKPEYEVIHTLLSLSTTQMALEISSLHTSSPLPEPNMPSEQLGSKNYTKPPAAIIMGGAYNDELFGEIYDKVERGEGKTPFLRCDLSQETPPLGPLYAEALVGRIKGVLGGLIGKGGLGVDEGNVVWY